MMLNVVNDCWELIQSTSEYFDVACHLLYVVVVVVVVDLRGIPESHCCWSVSSLHPPSVHLSHFWMEYV